MKRLLHIFMLPLLLAGFISLAVAPEAMAATGDCPEGTVKTSFFGCVRKDGTGAQNPIFVGLLQVFNFLTIGIGVIVTGGIIYGGILFSTGGGDMAKTKKGTAIIINSVTGLVLFLFMFAIINFVVPGGLFR